MTRRQLSSTALVVLAGLGILSCLAIAAPFLSALTWALALAVVANPLHNWFGQRIRSCGVSAALSVVTVLLILLLPVLLVSQQVAHEAAERFDTFRDVISSGKLESMMNQDPRLAGVTKWVKSNVNFEQEMRGFASGAGAWFRTSAWAIVQLLVALFVLFFLFRDQELALRTLRWIMPLSNTEADEVFERVRAMVHATIYGNVTVGAIQGILGGAMFAFLGIPGALLWGFVMALMALVPSMGAFVIWIPTAIVMAAQGNWGKAAILAAWGVLVVGSIDNILYPILVGKEMNFHTVPVFIATVGGLILFGAAGLVIGPAIFAFTVAILDVIRRRTVGTRTAEQPI